MEALRLKDPLAAKEGEVKDALNPIAYDEEIEAKELQMLEAGLIEDTEAQVSKYEAAATPRRRSSGNSRPSSGT